MSKIAGISFVFAGVLYLINLALLASLGPLPSGGEAFLIFLHNHMLVGQVSTLVFFVVDAVLIIGFTGLYSTFANRNAGLTIATVLSVVALTADEINNVVFYAYINLSTLFAAATSDQQRMAYGAVSGILGIVAGLTGFFSLIALWPVWFLAVAYQLLRSPSA